MRKLSSPKYLFSSLPRHDRYALAFLLCTAVLLLAAWYAPYLVPSADGSTQLVEARAITEGRRIRDIYRPDEPLAGHYPFGWPLILAPVYALAGLLPFAYKMLQAVFFVAASLAIYGFARRFLRPLMAILPAFAFMAHPLIIQTTQSALAEVAFGFFFYGALAAMAWSKLWKNHTFVTAAVVLTVVASSVRFVGETTVVALVLALLIEKRWFGLRVLGVALAVKLVLLFALQGTAWITGGYFATDLDVTSKVMDAAIQPYQSTNVQEVVRSTGGLFSLMLLNLRRLLLTHGPSGILPFGYHLFAMNKVKMLLCMAVSFTALAGLVQLVRRRFLFAALAIILMVGGILTRGNQIAVYRYYAPMSAFFVLLALLGAKTLLLAVAGNRIRPRIRNGVLIAAAALLLADRGLYNIRSRSEGPWDYSTIQDYIELCAAVSSTTSPERNLCSPAPAETFLLTDRKVVPYDYRGADPLPVIDLFTREKIPFFLVPGWYVLGSRHGMPRIEDMVGTGTRSVYYMLRYGDSEPSYLYYFPHTVPGFEYPYRLEAVLSAAADKTVKFEGPFHPGNE